MDDIDEWTWKKDDKSKKKKGPTKGGAQRGHEKQIEELNKKYND